MSLPSEPLQSDPGLYVILPGEALPRGGAASVGNKAWNLMRMASAGLPVPPAFVLPTHWGQTVPEALRAGALEAALSDGIGQLERATGSRFGAANRPLLVSVRSGAAISMPGMMETVLDVGVNDETVEGLVRATGNPRLAWDSYRRLVQGYADVVQGLPSEPFDALIRETVASEGRENERRLDHVALRRLARAMLVRFAELAGTPFPQSVTEQLARAAGAVFASWDAPKACDYRRLNQIDATIGTAVTVQTMVFGNAGGLSGAGVGFTRNPATGENALYLDFQLNAQGEDVVAGRLAIADSDRLRAALPSVSATLETMRARLEMMFGDVQDFEFTVQDGVLFLLQTRDAKRTPWAAVKIAVDLVAEGVIAPKVALAHLAGTDLGSVTRRRLSGGQEGALARAMPAGIGVVAGRVALDPDSAKRMAGAGDPVILVRRETTTGDILGMSDAAGILTALGGRTSHAAVVARQLGKVCLVGCATLSIDLSKRQGRLGDHPFAEGDWLTLDGDEGVVYGGQRTTIEERPDAALSIIRGWQAGSAPAHI